MQLKTIPSFIHDQISPPCVYVYFCLPNMAKVYSNGFNTTLDHRKVRDPNPRAPSPRPNPRRIRIPPSIFQCLVVHEQPRRKSLYQMDSHSLPSTLQAGITSPPYTLSIHTHTSFHSQSTFPPVQLDIDHPTCQKSRSPQIKSIICFHSIPIHIDHVLST